MKRICFFCFYDKYGVVDDSVEYLLNELKLNSDRLIIAVNGCIEPISMQKLYRFSKEIFIRKNVGFDAGAYKDIMFHYLNQEEIMKYDELILCNDTFIGPFIELKSIFETMDKKKCDFWGITCVDWKFLPCIPSYFLVFRSAIIHSIHFYKYWIENIDENTMEIEDVYGQFETGLFYYLTKEEKRIFASYIFSNNCNFYTSIGVCVKKYGIPLIKKKALRNFNNNIDNIMDALQYLQTNSCYPIQYITDYIDRMCNIQLTDSKIRNYIINQNKVKENPFVLTEITTENFKNRIDNSPGFYIYGCGIWARRIYWVFCKDNKYFKGFIVSDITSLKSNRLYNYTIEQIDKIDLKNSDEIVLGVNKANAINIVQTHLKGINQDRIISIFPKTIESLYS